MTDDKGLRAPQDAQRVNVHESYELEYWTNRFSTSAARLKAAVQKVGVSVDAVAAELNG